MKIKIKSTVLLGVSLLFTTMASFAQEHKEPNKPKMSIEQKEQRFAEVSKRLNLTVDQQAKLKSIILQNKTEMTELREANKHQPKEIKREAMMKQFKKIDAQVNGILDDKQRIEYSKLKEERKLEMRKKREEHKNSKEEMEYYKGIF
jgi:protein CpxP